MFVYSDYFLCFLIVAYAFYVLLIVPFFCSKLISKISGSEGFWYIVVALLNVYVLLYVLIRAKYRSKLSIKAKFLLTVFMIGYFFFLVPIWMLMDIS